MLHKNRRFVVVDVASPEELAEKLTQHTWCGCNGFRLGELLFLNDSTSPDGAQEYAVVRGGRQIESITFSWCTVAEALGHVRQLLDGTLGEDALGAVSNRIESPAQHGTCAHCA
jgi:hypothetical protein